MPFVPLPPTAITAANVVGPFKPGPRNSDPAEAADTCGEPCIPEGIRAAATACSIHSGGEGTALVLIRTYPTPGTMPLADAELRIGSRSTPTIAGVINAENENSELSYLNYCTRNLFSVTSSCQSGLWTWNVGHSLLLLPTSSATPNGSSSSPSSFPSASFPPGRTRQHLQQLPAREEEYHLQAPNSATITTTITTTTSQSASRWTERDDLQNGLSASGSQQPETAVTTSASDTNMASPHPNLQQQDDLLVLVRRHAIATPAPEPQSFPDECDRREAGQGDLLLELSASRSCRSDGSGSSISTRSKVNDSRLAQRWSREWRRRDRLKAPGHGSICSSLPRSAAAADALAGCPAAAAHTAAILPATICPGSATTNRRSDDGDGAAAGGRRSKGLKRQLPLLLLLLAALQGHLFEGGGFAAAAWSSWPWVGKSKTTSAAVKNSAPVPAAGGLHLQGVLPYGGLKNIDHDAATASSSSSRTSSSNRAGDSSGGISSKSRSSSSSSRGNSKSRTAGSRSSSKSVGAVGHMSKAYGHDGDGVTFSAGLVPIVVNPAGNVTALLQYDPYHRPPRPPPPAPKSKRRRKPKKPSGPSDLCDAQLALRELLTSGHLPYDPMKPYKLPATLHETKDFVFATGSFPSRYLLAQSSRSWRRGIRAFIAVNNTEDLPLLNAQNKVHKERYEFFPDDGTGELGPVFHGFMPGDTRAAMAPFLAHKYFRQTYKWMLYGDDDTMFYMPAVKRLLAHLDPELPIAISDNLWFRARHPNLLAPRCLPCHLAVDADPQPQPPHPPPEQAAAGGGAGRSSKWHAGAPEATRAIRIPNITAVMDGYKRFLVGARSAADMQSARVQKQFSTNTFVDFNKSLAAIADLPLNASVPGVRYLPAPACPFCTAEAACTPMPPAVVNVSGAGCFASGGHGGAGMIFSVGLMRRLSPDRMKKCYMKIIKAPGGDGMLSACLWEAGYAFTDPGATTLARYDGNHILFSSEAGKWVLHDPLEVLLRGKCDSRCKWLLRNAVTHHGRGRHFQNFEQSAAYLYGNMASYMAAHKWMAFMATRDLDLAELAELMAAAEAGVGSNSNDGSSEA